MNPGRAVTALGRAARLLGIRFSTNVSLVGEGVEELSILGEEGRDDSMLWNRRLLGT